MTKENINRQLDQAVDNLNTARDIDLELFYDYTLEEDIEIDVTSLRDIQRRIKSIEEDVLKLKI